MSAAMETFYVGGRYYEADQGPVMAGHAYIQHHTPAEVRQPYPIVMIHGGHQMAVNFETTPDGRPGWLHNFLDEGYDVYLMDQPGRGRSPYAYEVYGEPGRPYSGDRYMKRTTLAAKYQLWPQAHLHNQWPGTGEPGDPSFDQFFASQSPCIADADLRERLVRAAGAELLDRIGPAVLLTHSQSGHFGWHLADARPELVKGIIAVEPGGPPVVEIQTIGAPDYYREVPGSRVYGITSTALHYDPPVEDPAVDLALAQEQTPDHAGGVRCWLQAEPPRVLTNLVGIPVWVVTGEASFHAGYDHCTVKYLRQAGVAATHVLLADSGVTGNGHMMMLEKNSAQIAARLQEILRDGGLAGQAQHEM